MTVNRRSPRIRTTTGTAMAGPSAPDARRTKLVATDGTRAGLVIEFTARDPGRAKRSATTD
jgi:hypothetical protein